jgi:hypothetical protein
VFIGGNKVSLNYRLGGVSHSFYGHFAHCCITNRDCEM